MSVVALKTESMNATDAKNHFGELFEKVGKNGAVSLTKRGKPAAYVISPAMFERLERVIGSAPGPLQRLEEEFDQMIARMQSPERLKAAKSLMTVDAADLRENVRTPVRKLTRRG